MTDANQEKLLHRFFKDQITPLAEKLRAEGGQFFPLGPDDQEPTWYVDYPPDPPEISQFKATDAGAELQRWWAAQGYDPIVPLVAPLMELGEALSAQAAEETDDVSPFIYVMF